MQYSKPEVVEVGSAVDVIQSTLRKGSSPLDSLNDGDFTTSGAYQADE